jgi:uncharacterized protein (TIGR03000 family)
MNLRINVVGLALTLLVSFPWPWRSEAQSPQPIYPIHQGWTDEPDGARILAYGHAVSAIAFSQTHPSPTDPTDFSRATARLTPAKPAQARPTITSRIQVIVPDDDAELSFENEVTKTAGTIRDFETPPLEPGRAYRYTFSVKWAPNNYTTITRTRTISFNAGESITVDLTINASNDRAQIRYVPTPDFVVDEMIRLARIRSDDVVYEPGCGDARITIAAVRAGARRGVGIDLDTERVAESRTNVRSAGLDDRIEVRAGDALDLKDLGEASVVFLYMGDEFNRMIRPLLWKQLKVGARVVSHRFTMGEWAPDKTVHLDQGDAGEYPVHLWTITQEVKNRAANF